MRRSNPRWTLICLPGPGKGYVSTRLPTNHEIKNVLGGYVYVFQYGQPHQLFTLFRDVKLPFQIFRPNFKTASGNITPGRDEILQQLIEQESNLSTTNAVTTLQLGLIQ